MARFSPAVDEDRRSFARFGVGPIPVRKKDDVIKGIRAAQFFMTGRERRVEPVGFPKIYALGVAAQRVLVISDITSDAERWQTLGDGYRVESSFILWENEDVLQIPASALFRVDDQWALFVMENNQANRRRVEVGQRNGLYAQILDGLAEGEAVITHPDRTIEDGIGVKRR